MSDLNFKPNSLFIHDNLPVLRGMNSECVDLIYLDPPFNSNRMYQGLDGSAAAKQSFSDIWKWDTIDDKWLAEIDRANPALSAVINAAKVVQGESTAAYLAFMGVRLIELRRVLKDSGSIYLHCDPTANAYLRLAMDAVFGKSNFRNEIVWSYRKWANNAKCYQKNHDTLFFYALDDYTFHKPLGDHSANQLALMKRGYNGGTNSAGHKIVRVYDEDAPAVQERMASWEAEGRRIYYVEPPQGLAVPSVWDMSILSGSAKERTGWATQKPLALLQRIIKASSNPGDLVLDPFAGCATACVAAAMEGRRWIGIEQCKDGADILDVRLDDAVFGELGQQIGKLGQTSGKRAVKYKKPPVRTDANGDAGPRKRTNAYKTREVKDTLYGRQRGDCNGCKLHYHAKDLDVDHIVPVSKGGDDLITNLQLLCANCNAIKGDRDMAYLRKRLAEREAKRLAD